MRVSREKALETRERILVAAARLFRDKGFDAVGVDAIMTEAGLTHGGFYGHFRSKRDLAAAALKQALDGTLDVQRGLATRGERLLAYLSPGHRDAVGSGCAMAALGPEVARQGETARRTLTEHIETQAADMQALAQREGAPASRAEALAELSTMVGALILARAVDDEKLSDEILAAAQAALAPAAPARQ